MDHLGRFKVFLSSPAQASKTTAKNYIADISQFVRWYENHYHESFNPDEVNSFTIQEFKKDFSGTLSQASLDRHLSSLRKFFHFLKIEGLASKDPFEQMKTVSAEAEALRDPFRLQDFKNNLYVFNASRLTIKNYLIDVKQFFSWVMSNATAAQEAFDSSDLFEYIDARLIEEYKRVLLQEGKFSPASVNRKLSSLRKYLGWAQSEGLLPSYELGVMNYELPKVKPISNLAIEQSNNLASQGVALRSYSGFPPLRLLQKTIKPFVFAFDSLIIAPMTQVFDKAEDFIWRFRGKPIFQRQKSKGKSQNFPFVPNTKYKILNTKQISNISKSVYASRFISTKHLPIHRKVWFHAKHTRPDWYRKYHSYPITNYIHLAILMIFMAAIGYVFYDAFIGSAKNQKPTFATTSPPRILSFQGRLTDSSDNPITATTSLRFAIYNSLTASGSALLWQETKAISPDSDGIFATLLGDGTSIPQHLFADNSSLWLGVTVGATPELTPRQRLATVAYATNAEFLQGLPPITNSGNTTNVVLALNSSGNLVIGGSATPTFQASGGQFTLSGSTLLLTTTSSSNSNVVVKPDGIGKIDLQKPMQNTTNNNNISTAVGAVEVNDLFAILATSSGQSAFTLNQTSTGPLISASTSGTAKFTVDNSGNLSIASGTTFDTISSGTLGVGTTNATTLTLGRSGQGITLPGFTGANGALYGTSGTGVLAQATTSVSSLCLVSGASAPSWASCNSSGTDVFWSQSSGALFPNNSTVDLLVGGQATTSAKFSVINVNSGTPTATISANSGNNATTLTGTGILGTTNAQTLTLGNSTTGNVVIDAGSNVTSFSDPTINLTASSPIIDLTSATTLSLNTTTNRPITTGTGLTTLGGALTINGTTVNIGNGSASTIQTPSGNANINIAPNGTGRLGVNASSPLSSLDIRQTSGTIAVASVSGATSFASLVVDNSGVGDLFTASASGLPLFTVLNSGSLSLNGINPTIRNARTNSTLELSANGTGTLTLNGNSNTGNIQFFSGSNTITSGGALTLAGAVVSVGVNSGSGLLQGTGGITVTGTANINATGTSATNIGNSTGALVIASGGTSSWTNTSGNLTIQTATSGTMAVDSAEALNLGTTNSTSTSLGKSATTLTINPTSWTATPTVSGLITGTSGISLGASTDITTGTNQNLNIVPNGTGLIGIFTTATPLSSLDIRQTSGTIAVASVSGATSFASLAVDNSGVGDIFTASSSGLNRFVIAQGGNVGIGTATPTTFKLEIAGIIGPTVGSTHDLGSSSRRWATIYGDTGNFTSLSAGSTSISGTTSQDFLINSDNATADTEDATLTFERGTPVTNSQFKWNSITKQLSTNTPSFAILPDTTIAYSGTAALIVDQVQSQDIFSASASGTTRFTISNGGNVTLNGGTTITGTSLTSITGGATAIDFTEFDVSATTGSITINDVGNAGQIDIESTILDIDSLTFVGTGSLFSTGDMTIDSTTDIVLDADGADVFFKDATTTFATFTNSSTDLTLDIAGGQLLLADTDTFNIGGVSALAYNALANSGGAAGGANVTADNDLYVQGALEVDDVLYLDGTLDTTFTAGSVVFTGTSGVLAEDNTNFFFDDSNNRLGIGINSSLLGTLDVRKTLGTLPVATISGATSFASLVVDNSGVGDIFTASASGLPLWTILNSGSEQLNGINPTIRNARTNSTLELSANGTGTLTLNGNSNTGNIQFFSSSYNITSAGALTVASCTGCGGSNWRYNLGTLSPINDTVDVLIGANATTSAKFAVLNVNSGTPTASLSAGSAGGAYLNATGTLSTTAMQTLTLGGSTTGNITIDAGSNITSFSDATINLTASSPIIDLTSSTTLSLNTTTNRPITTGTGLTTLGGSLTVNGATLTGGNGSDFTQTTTSNANLILNPNGTGKVDINHGNTPLSSLDIRSKSGTISVASVSGATSFASLTVDNSGVGDIFTASSSGLNRFVITQAGNVGVGTTTPSSGAGGGIMEIVNNPASTNTALTVLNLTRSTTGTAANSIGARLEYLLEDDGGTVQEAATINGIFTDVTAGSVDSALTFFTRVNSGSFAEQMRIDANGNVGIGTTAPVEKMHVAGNVLVGAQTDATAHNFGSGCSCLTNSAAGTFGADINKNGVTASVVFKGKLFVSADNTNLAGVYRYDGGTTWTLVTNAIGKAVSGDSANIDSYSMTVYNGALYIGSRGTASTAGIYSSTTADTTADSFTLVNATRGSFGMSVTVADGVSDMTVYNGTLFISTEEANVAEIGRYDGGTTFTQINATDGKTAAEATADMDGANFAVYRGRLFIGAITGSTTARVGVYDGVGTTITNLNATLGTFGANASEVDVTSFAVWNGELYVAVSKTDATGVYRWLPSNLSVDTTATNWDLVTNAVGKVVSGDTANIDSIILRTYNGRLYIGSQTSFIEGTAALYEYDGTKGSWTLINTTRGTFGAQTTVQAITTMIENNGTFYVGTNSLNTSSVYSWTKTAQNSFALKFDSGSTNYGAINFVGNRQAGDENSHYGVFNFSHTISTETGSYDVAEDYPTRDDSLEPGDLVTIDTSEAGFVKKSTGEGDRDLIGIYSSDPAVRLSQLDLTISGGLAVPIALAGRVPVKVSTQSGQIKPGDYITASSIPGVGMKATRSGRVIGKALGYYSSDTHEEIGKVMVFIETGYIDPNPPIITTVEGIKNYVLSKTEDLASQGLALRSYAYQVTDALGHVVDQAQVLASAVIGDLSAGIIQTTDLIASNISTTYLKTDVISPLSEKLVIQLASDSGKLEIQNASGSAVASIDNLGNASFSGQLSAKDATISGNLSAADASLSGTLRASRIIADQIEGLASPSANQYVTNNYFFTASDSADSSSSAGLADVGFDGNFDIATLSAQAAYFNSINGATATFTQGLMSFGPSSLYDVSVAGQLSVGAELILADTSINVLGSTLSIQPLKQGGVDFLAGAVKINIDGNLEVNGNANFAKNVSIKGVLSTNIISPLPDQDLVIKLASQGFSLRGIQPEGHPLEPTKLDVKNASNSSVFTITSAGDFVASGAGTFDKLNLSLIPQALALSPTELIATGSAGTLSLKANEDEITVINELVTQNSLIYITPVGATSGQNLYLSRQTAENPAISGIEGSFTVGVNQSIPVNTRFNYLIIN